jgi:hypothetical protein
LRIFAVDKLDGIFVETLSLRSESGVRVRMLSLGISPLFQTCNHRVNHREKEKIVMNIFRLKRSDSMNQKFTERTLLLVGLVALAGLASICLVNCAAENKSLVSMTQVALPTFVPAGKTTPSSGISVRVTSATAYCRISYTTDRTTPTPTHGRIIANGATATVTAGTAGEVTKTLKAIAFKSGMTPSAVRSGTYVLNSSIL